MTRKVGPEPNNYIPDFCSSKSALDMLVEAISVAGYVGKIVIGMDVASSEMYVKGGKYDMNFKDTQTTSREVLTGDKLLEYYLNLVSHYPIVSIEDPFDQDDWDHWIKFRSNSNIQVSEF